MVTDKELKDAHKSWTYQQVIQDIMPPYISEHDRLMHFGNLSFEAGAKWMQEKMKIENHHCDQCTEERDGEWFCTVCGNG